MQALCFNRTTSFVTTIKKTFFMEEYSPLRERRWKTYLSCQIVKYDVENSRIFCIIFLIQQYFPTWKLNVKLCYAVVFLRCDDLNPSPDSCSNSAAIRAIHSVCRIYEQYLFRHVLLQRSNR